MEYAMSCKNHQSPLDSYNLWVYLPKVQYITWVVSSALRHETPFFRSPLTHEQNYGKECWEKMCL